MNGSFAALLPTPLHPAIVHLPMALAVLVPIFAVAALVAVRRGARPIRAWSITVAMFAALTLSSWVSVETGEDQEDRVESTVPRAAFHAHEDAASLFLWMSAGVLGIAGIGLLASRAGSTARWVATAGSAALLVAGYRVGHTGGAMVYTYGAASAYTDSAAVAAGNAATTSSGRARASGDADDDDNR